MNFTGERYSCVFFSVLDAYKASRDMKGRLKDVGFNVPNGIEDYDMLKIASNTSQSAAKEDASAESANNIYSLSVQWMKCQEDTIFYFGNNEEEHGCLGLDTMHHPFHIGVVIGDAQQDDVLCLDIRQAIHVVKASRGSDPEVLDRLQLCKTTEEIEDVCNDVVARDAEAWCNSLRYVTYEVATAVAELDSQVRETLFKCEHKLIGYASKNTIWGCWYDYDEAHALTAKQWRGLNMLGDAWMKVRDKLANQTTQKEEDEEDRARESRAAREQVNLEEMTDQDVFQNIAAGECDGDGQQNAKKEIARQTCQAGSCIGTDHDLATMCQEHEIHDTKDQGKSSSDQKQRDAKLHAIK